jgi:hypothetical protein
MTEKLKNNYYSHLESDQSDSSMTMTGKEQKSSKVSAGDGASTMQTSTYNTRSKGTRGRQTKHIFPSMIASKKKQTSRTQSPSSKIDLQVKQHLSGNRDRTSGNFSGIDHEGVKDRQRYETEMISLINRYFTNYLQQYPADKYATFIQKCFQNGLVQATDIASMRTSVNVADNNRLLMMLRKSVALKEYMTFSVGQDQLLTYELTQKAMEEWDQKPFQCIHEINPQTILRFFTPRCMKNWAFTHSSEFYAVMWMEAIELGLNQLSTWNEIKKLLDIDDLREYYYSIEECEDVFQRFQCETDPRTNKLTYVDPQQNKCNSTDDANIQPTDADQETTSNVNAPVANIIVSTSVTPQTMNLATQHHLHVPDFEEDPITMDDDQDTIPTVDDELQWQPYHPENNFSYVHSIIFHYVKQWAIVNSSKSHPFYPQFQQFKYAGLKNIMKWTAVQKVLKMQSLSQYVDFVQLCPAVVENLRLAIDSENDTIHFTWKTIMTDQDVLATIQKAQLSYQGLQNLAFTF